MWIVERLDEPKSYFDGWQWTPNRALAREWIHRNEAVLAMTDQWKRMTFQQRKYVRFREVSE